MIQSIRGTRDLYQESSERFHQIESLAKKVFRERGFREIRTPLLEFSELFERGLGEETEVAKKQMYRLQDGKGRWMALRPENTAPVVRAFIQHPSLQENPLQRLYYLGPMFRHERPQAGRYRQFFQLGCEVFGGTSPWYDAEVIHLALSFLKQLGLNDMQVSLNSIGCDLCQPNYLKTLREFLKGKKICEDCENRLETNPLRCLDCKRPDCKEACVKAPSPADCLCKACKDHHQTLQKILNEMKIPWKPSPCLVRGLDYYTRTVFEVLTDRLGSQDAVLGGGRYDKLVEQMGGKPTPAVGFAAGIDRLELLLPEQKSSAAMIFLIPLGEENKACAFRFAEQWRKEGLEVCVAWEDKKLKKQMKEANKLKMPWVCLIGDQERLENKVKMKEMKTGTETLMKAEEVSAYCRKETK